MNRNATPRRARTAARSILRFLERVFAGIGIIAVVYHCTLHFSVITSGSMAPTLRGDSPATGDLVLSERLSFWFRNPRRWEVVAFFEPEQHVQAMKRVVGLPAECISFDQKTQIFSIDGVDVMRPAALRSIKYFGYGSLAQGKTVSGDQGYYVLGDDSADSQDSRWIGTIDPSRIFARAWLVVWPPSHIRFVNP